MDEENNIAKPREVAYAMVRGDGSITELMERFGIDEAEFTEWICGGKFTDYAMSLARGYAEADAPYVWRTLRDLIHGGSVPAIRLYFDLLAKKPSGAGAENHGGAELSGLRESIFAAGGEDGA